MSPRRIALIVGNGLAIDFARFIHPGLVHWDPASPLQFDIRNPPPDGRPLLEVFSDVAAHVRKVRAESPGLKDFEYIHQVVANADRESNRIDRDNILEGLCRFLAGAYSCFQFACDELPFDGWHWLTWARSHAPHLVMTVSFNYDLILETLLSRAGIKYRRTAIPDEVGLPLLKPHGSIDFRPSPRAVPPGVILTLCNVPQIGLERDRLLYPRQEATIVLPGHASHIRNYQWVAPGFQYWAQLAPTWSDLVIVGLSYWECDRPEINELLAGLSPGTRVWHVDPTKTDHKDLREAAEERRLRYTRCRNGIPWLVPQPHAAPTESR